MVQHRPAGLLCLIVLGACGGGGASAPVAPAGPVPAFRPGPGQDYALMLPDRIAQGYLDGDDHPDVVLAGDLVDIARDGALTLHAMLGTGDGSFAGATPLVGLRPGSTYPLLPVLLGHFNLDGNLDAVVFEQGPAETGALVCLGDGSGSFTPRTSAPVPLGHRVLNVAVVNANDDYYDDLGFAAESPYVGFLLSNGVGGFVPAGTGNAILFSPILSIAVSDVDLDGHVDVLALQSTGVLVFHGDGSGGLAVGGGGVPVQSAKRMAVDRLNYPRLLAVVSVLPVAHVGFYRHDGVGGFTEEYSERVDLLPGYEDVWAIAFAREGPSNSSRAGAAVLAYSLSDDRSRLFWAHPEDADGLSEEIPTGMDHARGLTVADVDGDQWDDLVVAGYSGSRVPGYRGALQTLLGRGDP